MSSLVFDVQPTDQTRDAIFAAIIEARKNPRISDLHLYPHEVPSVRIDGDIAPAGSNKLSVEALSDFLAAIAVDADAKKALTRQFGAYTLVHEAPEIGRMRVTVYRSSVNDAIAIRLLGDEPPELESLSLPPVFQRIVETDRGSSIIAGPVGTGKTTALAAVVKRIAATKTKTICILEEYAEYVHKSDKSIVRSIIIGPGGDAPTYEAALDTALKNDADIIIIAEARSPEALLAALVAADLGKRVILTVHIDSVTRFADRILGAFPPEQQGMVRMLLAGQIQEVVYTQLPKRIEPTEKFGRIPACEILTRRSGFVSVVGDTEKAKSVSLEVALQNYIGGGKEKGDRLLEDSLFDLARVKNLISDDEALRVAIRPESLQSKFGGRPTEDGRW